MAWTPDRQRRSRRRPRRGARVVAVVAVLFAATGCEPHTVAVRFAPQVGDEYRYRSEVHTDVTRTVEDESEVVADDALLTALEQVVEIGDDVRVDITVSRDGAAPRTFEVRLDRASRLTAIDLIEGVPAEALGLELGTDLPADIASPPPGPLEPGARWTIRVPVTIEGVDEPVVVTGTGRIDSLGVEDGTDVAVAVVDLEVPVRSVVETDDGRVTLLGTQSSSSRTAYALEDGTVHRDRTTIDGEVSLIIEPPADLDVAPLEGSIEYHVRTDTRRVA